MLAPGDNEKRTMRCECPGRGAATTGNRSAEVAFARARPEAAGQRARRAEQAVRLFAPGQQRSLAVGGGGFHVGREFCLRIAGIIATAASAGDTLRFARKCEAPHTVARPP